MKVQKWQQEKKFIEKNKNAERPGGIQKETLAM